VAGGRGDSAVLEYPGELLTDPDAPGSTAQATLLKAIAGADALVGIIDGFRLLQAHNGDQRGQLMLEASLDAMINAMLPVRSPIVFVITKWDLLDHLHPDENERLRMVRERLMDTPGFRRPGQGPQRPADRAADPGHRRRHDFAEYRDGAVRKNPGGRFLPSNVEAALSVVVPDILRQTEMSLDHATRAELLAAAQRRVRMGRARRCGRSARTSRGRPRGSCSPRSVRVLVAESGLSLLLDTLGPRGYDPAEHSARLARLGEADRRAEEFVQARRRVVGELQRQVAVLEAKLPDSRLGGDRWGDW